MRYYAMITFDGSFANYGDSINTILQEIYDDVLRSIMTTLGITAFDRGYGSGIEDLENEILDNPVLITMLKLSIFNAVMNYNANVIPDRQVVVSQQSIFVVPDKQGNVRIVCFVIPLAIRTILKLSI